MALIIGVKKGDAIYVDDLKVTIEKTEGYHSMDITLERKDGQIVPFKVSDTKSIEILKNVRVSCGKPKNSSDGGLPRLVFEAPKNIVLLRADLYLANAKTV